MISLTNVYWLVTHLCVKHIYINQKLVNIVLVVHLLNTNKEFENAGLLSEIYKNELDKACFHHDMANSMYKDLKGRTQSDIVLKDKAFQIAQNLKYDGFQRALAGLVWKFFNERSKKVLGSGIENKQLADEFHKPINFFKDNIWGVDLADMQLTSRFNKKIRYLLCVIDLFSRYAWVVPLKDKNSVSIVNAFQGVFKKSDKKPNKIWVDIAVNSKIMFFKIF